MTAASRQGELDLASLDEFQGLDGAGFDEVDVHSGSRLQIPREKRREHVLNHLRRAGDAQTSCLAASDGLRMLGKLAHAGEQLTTPQEQTLTRARHAHSAAGTLEEPDAQLCLQVADLSPQCGLRDVHPGGSP